MGTHRAIALGKLGGSKRTKLVIVTSNRNIVPSANRAYEKLAAHAITQQMEVKQGQQWMDWAQWMSAKYQRTSSAVEGRNGYLSGLHHAGRGLSEQTLKVLTIIHNFDLKRADGTTAAQRLFDHRFPDLFEWVVDKGGRTPRGPTLLQSSTSQSLTPSSFFGLSWYPLFDLT